MRDPDYYVVMLSAFLEEWGVEYYDFHYFADKGINWGDYYYCHCLGSQYLYPELSLVYEESGYLAVDCVMIKAVKVVKFDT